MKAPIKGPTALETRIAGEQSSLEVVDASRRKPDNVSDAPLMTVMNS